MEENKDVEVTPLMKQYWDLKSQAGDALLLFRMGDFYELFGDDAVEAARILEITLTSRDKNKPNPLPMCGVPHHSVQGYIQKLLAAGKRVSIGEQFAEEAPAKTGKGAGKSIVRREIVRTFTPAVQFDSEGSEAAYLATVVRTHDAPLNQKVGTTFWILACLDVSTGETRVSQALESERVLDEILTLPIRHFVAMETTAGQFVLKKETFPHLYETLPNNYLSLPQARQVLKTHYGFEDFSAYLPGDPGVQALALLLNYATRSQFKEKLNHVRLPSPLHPAQCLTLGPQSARHLDLTPELFDMINHTASSLGNRQLRKWLLEPLKKSDEILFRQSAVRELSDSTRSHEGIRSTLKDLYDLERITGRVSTGLANPRDTLALGKSLALLPRVRDLLRFHKTPLLQEFLSKLTDATTELTPFGEKIVKMQRDDAPLVSREGGIFNTGVSPELDRLLMLTSDGEKWLVELEARERAATGIPSLKVRYNRVFGYYLEVTQAHLKNVPSHYQRKQTTVGAERFFTEELKKFEDEMVTASVRLKQLEQKLFEDLIEEIQSRTAELMTLAQILAELDALNSLAALAFRPGWTFPSIDDSLDLEIKSGRHPLVDASKGGHYVPNDITLKPDTQRCLLITGPNMGGKSTLMRQAALIIILGQMGAPVPAAQARWGTFSSVYTRIGAHDAIARGQSTFMVEMSELAHIIHHADERSLIVLDEIGRGTSTYDGISVAWACLEWICHKIQARTLFATHYHELTHLTTSLPATANFHMAVEVQGNATLRFLYKLKEGPTGDSFGIYVAKLAGLPNALIDRAWKVLEKLESPQGLHAEPINSNQLSLFAPTAPLPVSELEPEPTPAWIEKLRSMDINSMTPLQAMNFLSEVVRDANDAKAAKEAT
ncbi:DNA mismatch repair protein MutS [bacterium]|jgi:DNA mismatch repair protein MutS|nr:DNA mismatch repair protein MutS [bacterium]